MATQSPTRIWLIRHGETEWTLSGAHTSRTDIPLTDHGRERASAIRDYLAHIKFSLVLSSPRQRALETAKLAGFADTLKIDDNLREWDYGIYEGRSTPQIREELGDPNWSIWDQTPPEGESLDHVATRAHALIERALEAGGDVAMFSHAHFLRILAATWIGLPPNGGRLFTLSTGAINRLGFERTTRVISLWNLSFEDPANHKK